MATYAIGDIQGCYSELLHLLEKINYRPGQDQLWFVGDLVNRGPDSLGVLRFIKSLQPQPIVVLGNHDFHLLASDKSLAPPKYAHSFDEILSAPDRDELIAWLRQKPLFHYDHKLNYAMVHAGLPPQWNLEQAQACAQELEAMIQHDDYCEFLYRMYADEPATWRSDLTGWDRLCFICNAFTRIRFCDADGKLNLKNKGTLDAQEAGEMPWFNVPKRRSESVRIVFGHWAALECKTGDANVVATDNGCAWGNLLTAVRLEDEARFSVDSLNKKNKEIHTP